MALSDRDRAAGVLLGLAAGDLNGGPSRMAVRLAESLADCGRFDADDVGRRYLAWWRDGAFDTGPVAGHVLELASTGIAFETAARLVHEQLEGFTAGCNPAHRSAPQAMLVNIDDTELASAATIEAALTHHDPLAGDVAAALVILCRHLIRGLPWSNAVEIASQGRLALTKAALQSQPQEQIANGGFAPQALGAAMYFAGTRPDFVSALTDSIAFAGPANYCPVLAGSIAGARWGAGSVPECMLSHCEILERVETVARRLASGW